MRRAVRQGRRDAIFWGDVRHSFRQAPGGPRPQTGRERAATLWLLHKNLRLATNCYMLIVQKPTVSVRLLYRSCTLSLYALHQNLRAAGSLYIPIVQKSPGDVLFLYTHCAKTSRWRAMSTRKKGAYTRFAAASALFKNCFRHQKELSQTKQRITPPCGAKSPAQRHVTCMAASAKASPGFPGNAS